MSLKDEHLLAFVVEVRLRELANLCARRPDPERNLAAAPAVSVLGRHIVEVGEKSSPRRPSPR
jgi:hypothetical protein